MIPPATDGKSDLFTDRFIQWFPQLSQETRGFSEDGEYSLRSSAARNKPPFSLNAYSPKIYERWLRKAIGKYFLRSTAEERKPSLDRTSSLKTPNTAAEVSSSTPYGHPPGEENDDEAGLI